MRLLITTSLVAAALAGPAVAQGENSCVVVGDIAQMIMEARQAGVAMSKAIAVFQRYEADPLAQLAVSLVKEAYARPRFASDEYQKTATTEFRNEAEMECYSG